MNRLIFALALTPALLVTGAFADDIAPAVHKDLWCGLALQIHFVLPANATDDQKAQAKPFLDGAQMLIDRASAALKAANMTDDQIAKAKADLIPIITPEIAEGSTVKAEFSGEECSALIAPPDTSSSAPADTTSSAPADASSSSAQ